MMEVLTLADLLEKRPLEPIQLAYVALGTLQALGRAHAQGQVRGRLTPQDILLTDPVSLTETPSPPDATYETPDHLYGDPITPQTDLYAFGLILYELLTRRPPFVASNDEVLRQRQMEAPVPDPRVYSPDMDLDLLILLLSLLDKDPSFRPASAAEVRQRLMSIWRLGIVGTPPQPEDLVGQLLGRCRVESLIGEGRLAWVFLARDVFDEQPVAIKVFKPAVTQDPAPMARFRRDVAALFKLDSPHIAQPLGAGEFAGLWYLLVRYVRGRSLRDLIDASVQEAAPFSRREVLTFVEQAAQALALAHERGVAHGDVTPNNILISDQGRIVLTDFGLAAVQRIESDHPALAGIERVQGTPAYMAPEQIRDGSVAPAADVYALGIVTHELLAGQPPFVGETEAEVLVQHLEGDPSTVLSHRPELPPEIDIVLGRALVKDPASRLESPVILARALENAWYVPPPPEPPPPPKPPLMSRFRHISQDPTFRRRVGIGALVAVVILLGVCLMVSAGAVLLNSGSAGPAASPGTPAQPGTPATVLPATASVTVTLTVTPTLTSTPVPATARIYRAKYSGPQSFPGCAIRGRVFNAAGRGEADVWIELYNSNKQWILNTATGPGGWYDFTTSPGGYYLKLKNRRSAWSPLVLLKFEQLGVVDWHAR